MQALTPRPYTRAAVIAGYQHRNRMKWVWYFITESNDHVWLRSVADTCYLVYILYDCKRYDLDILTMLYISDTPVS